MPNPCVHRAVTATIHADLRSRKDAPHRIGLIDMNVAIWPRCAAVQARAAWAALRLLADVAEFFFRIPVRGGRWRGRGGGAGAGRAETRYGVFDKPIA